MLSCFHRDLSITQRELALGCNQLKAFIQEETGKLSQDNDRLAASLEAKQQKCCEVSNTTLVSIINILLL